MRNILITTLLLGCFITFASSSQRGLFEFHDSYGRCWRCLPGSACVRCNTALHPFVGGPPATWDRTCAKPSEGICTTNLGVKFPHVDIGFYWICAEEGIIVEAPCFCDHVFDMRAQECVKIEDLLTIACDVYANTDPYDCTSEEERPPPSTLSPTDTTTTTATTTASGNTPSIPTVSNEQTDSTTGIGTTISVPTVSNEPGTTTTMTTTTEPITPPTNVPTAPTDVPTPPTETPTPTAETTTQFTRTTEIGGPGASPHPDDTTVSISDEDSNSTPAPCVCIVWWPCWCNPCWNMPCHSCNGCVGMMG